MPATVAYVHGNRHELRRFGSALSTVAGAVLLGVGLVASVIALPLTIVLALLAVLAGAGGPDASVDQAWGSLLGSWAEATTIAFAALIVGGRLLRGRRRMILFLRRFGYAEATQAATVAAASTLGHGWRLVTLDDAATAPIGVPEATRLVYTAGALGRRSLRRAFELTAGRAMTLFWVAALATVVVPIVDAMTRDPSERAATFGEYAKLLADLVADRRLPDPIGVDLRLVFLVALGIVALAVLGYLLRMAAGLGMLVLAIPIGIARSTARAVERAESDKRLAIDGEANMQDRIGRIVRESRSFFAPRLSVVRVAPAVWRETVVRFARASAAVLVDVSEPSENLLWEIEQLRTLQARIVFVGEGDRVLALGKPAAGDHQSGSLDGRLSDILEGQRVLAYSTDARGLRLFARELADAFETAAG